MVTNIYLARHGQSEWNLTHTLMGHHDSPLTDQGKNEAQELAMSLKSANISVILSSDLGRALSTANIISSELHVSIVPNAGFRERTFGPNFEAKPLSKLQQSLANKISIQDHLEDSLRFSYKLEKDIESDEDIYTRFQQILIIEATKYPNQNILVVSHEGAIRAFMIGAKLRSYTEFPLGFMKNGMFFKISFNDGIFF